MCLVAVVLLHVTHTSFFSVSAKERPNKEATHKQNKRQNAKSVEHAMDALLQAATATKDLASGGRGDEDIQSAPQRSKCPRWPKQKVSPSGRYTDPSPPPLSSSRKGSDLAQDARSSSNSQNNKQIANNNAGTKTMQSRGRRNRGRPKRHKPGPSQALRSDTASTSQEEQSPREHSRAQKRQDGTLMGGGEVEALRRNMCVMRPK